MMEFPNILLILADCARSDKWIGKNRSTRTPNLDGLCRQGVTFPNTITEKSLTTPSFATLLTGFYSLRHGIHQVWGYRLGEHLPMLTHLLTAAGYRTYAEVSGPLLPEMGLNRGFDHYEYRAPCDYLHTRWGDRFISRLTRGYYRKPWFLMLHLWELHLPRQTSPAYGCPEFGQDDYERAVSMLDAQLKRVFDAAGKETFIIFTSDHGEKTQAETYQKGTAVPYVSQVLEIDKAGGPGLSEIASRVGPAVLQQLCTLCDKTIPEDVILQEVWEKQTSTFSWWTRLGDFFRLLKLLPRISLLDFPVLKSPLKLTAVLKKRGILDANISKRKVEGFVQSIGMDKVTEMVTRIFINSYRNHMQEGHAIHVYDFLVKIPLVLYRPGRLPAGSVYPQVIRLPDILPTILDMVGIDQRKFGDIDGRSVKSLIEGKAWRPLPAYLSVTGIPGALAMRGVRTHHYKYTYGPGNPDLPTELYNLCQDPQETRNIAVNEPGTCEELRRLADSFVPAGGQAPGPVMRPEADEQKRMETCLRGLGYLD